jgi:hypothetical protein
METYHCSAERFAQDTSAHQMTVSRADGVNRHLQFRSPAGSIYWFDVITWPGTLCINGDCGTYVFRRVTDMFDFFRNPAGSINPTYWAEKCVSGALDGIKRFEWDAFERAVRAYMDNVVDNDAAVEWAKEVRKEVFDSLGSIEQDQFGAVTFIRAFEHDGFHFTDWESDCREYTFHFIWCLRAIVWSIQQWDASQTAAAAA